ncbi:MAG: hypothetical protein QXU18_04105 [Thermoplasmatales archaeon]
MWNAFIRGKTHDLYGLIIIFLIFLYFLKTTYGSFLDTVAIVIGIAITFAIFADLWSHCFHH